MSKKFKIFYGDVLIMQSGKLQNGEKQYDHRTGIIKGPV
jgi:hypothetical protein